MAFEAFFSGGAPPPRARRVTLAISVSLHAGLVVLGIVSSFWNVDEIPPPVLHVTVMAPPSPPASPPPPPGNPAPRRPATAKPAAPKAEQRVVEAPTPDPVPPETPATRGPQPDRPSDAPSGGPGVPGGELGGDPNGSSGGVGQEAAAPLTVPPTVASGRLLFAPEPQIPPALARAGMAIFNLVKVCVGKQGTVHTATVVRSSDATWDANVTGAVLRWKFSPYLINGNPVPFCYLARFVPRFVP